jgi:hypothetical protein
MAAVRPDESNRMDELMFGTIGVRLRVGFVSHSTVRGFWGVFVGDGDVCIHGSGGFDSDGRTPRP